MAATQSLYKQSFIDQIRKDVEDCKSLDLYDRIKSPFSNDMVFKLIGIEKPEGLCDKMCEDAKNELKCAIHLYEAYKGRTPLQATDERLWIYLAHVDLYDYMTRRWPLSEARSRKRFEGEEVSDDELKKNFILDHWFGSRGYMRQGISNLWWSVFVSIDEERKNPYELTEYLFERYDFRTRRFASSVFARNKEGMIGLLQSMKESPIYNDSFEARSIFAMMYFNRLGGTRQLSALNRDFFISEMKRIEPEVEKIKKREDVVGNPHAFDNIL